MEFACCNNRKRENYVLKMLGSCTLCRKFSVTELHYSTCFLFELKSWASSKRSNKVYAKFQSSALSGKGWKSMSAFKRKRYILQSPVTQERNGFPFLFSEAAGGVWMETRTVAMNFRARTEYFRKCWECKNRSRTNCLATLSGWDSSGRQTLLQTCIKPLK